MGCKERSEHECKSYPKCDGCNAHTKDLTFKHRFPHKTYKDGEWDIVADSTACYRVHDNGEKELYSMGPVVNRLHEFEKLGYEPEDLKKIINRHDDLRRRYSMYRLMAHSSFGKMGTYQDTDSLSAKRDDAVDTLYYLCKLAGDVENAHCDDINSMYPSMMYTKDGFRELYVTNDKFKKMMDERIRDAILRPVTKQKVWVTTSSSIKDDEFLKKVKEAIKSFNIDKSPKITQLYVPEDWEPVEIKWPKKNPWLDFKHQFTATFKYTDTDSIKETSPSKIGVQFGEIARKAFDEGIEAGLKRPIRSGRYPWDIQKTIDKEKKEMFKIKRVLFNNPATIVFWADGDKTVVKAQNGEPYDPEKGLAMAISKKALGNDRGYYEEFYKQLGRGEKHSTPEQFNSEVAHKTALDQTSEELLNSLYASKWAYDILEKVLQNPKATKAELLDAIKSSMEGLYEYAR